MIDFSPKNILDIGCGDGAVFSEINWSFQRFVGIDLSSQMLNSHPKDKRVELIKKDFDTLEKDFIKSFDIVISSSALQWSKDPYTFMQMLDFVSNSFAVSVFCDKTFCNLREHLGIDTFLPKSERFKEILSKDIYFETKHYELDFKDNLQMLRYIKRSGVSGGEKRVSVKSLRDFIKFYDKKKLEFEVLFMIKTPQTL